MDYTDEVCWRGRVLTRIGVSKPRSEFFSHAGTVFLVDYQPNGDHTGATISRQEVVPWPFADVARRFQITLDRYYDELCNPGEWAFQSNVVAAIGMATAATCFVRRWMQHCQAPAGVATSLAQAIFDVVKVHYGRVATSRVRLSAVEIAEANVAMMRGMTKVARVINNECNQIVA